MTTKQCTNCDEVKPSEGFYKRKDTRDGLQRECKICQTSRRTAERRFNPDRHRENGRKYYAANREQTLTNTRKHYEANRERYSLTHHKWYEANKDKKLEQNREWRESNRELASEHASRWRKANPKRVRETERRYKLKRRLLLAGARCDLTLQQWEQIKAFYKHRCALCGEQTQLTRDHVIPITKGGEHTASNIIPLCRSCNSRKGNRELKKVFQPHLLMAINDAT